MELLEIILELLQIIGLQQIPETQRVELADHEFHIQIEIQVQQIIHIGVVIHLLQTEEVIANLAVTEQEIMVLEVVLVIIEIIADLLLHREVEVALDHPHHLQEVAAVEPLLQEAVHLDHHPHLQEVVVQDVQIDKKN